MTTRPPNVPSGSSAQPRTTGLFPPQAQLWDRVPPGLKWAVVFAVLGFFVSISSTTTVNDNGAVKCSFLDVGEIGFAVLALVAVIIGCRQEFSKTHDRLKLGRTPTLLIAASVVVVSAYHVVAGLGLVGGPCN